MRTLRAAALLTYKDLVSLRRAPLVVILLACYPLLIAGLVGLVAGYANARPRVAVVDLDHIPPTTKIAGHKYHIKAAIDEVAKNVHISWMSKPAADQALRTGSIVGVITIPQGFLTDLKSVVHSPTLEFETAQGGISSRVTQQMQALVYNLNLKLQGAFIKDAIRYISLIQRGGKANFLGSSYNVLGIQKARALLLKEKGNATAIEVARFLDTAEGALRASQVSASAGQVQLAATFPAVPFLTAAWHATMARSWFTSAIRIRRATSRKTPTTTGVTTMHVIRAPTLPSPTRPEIHSSTSTAGPAQTTPARISRTSVRTVRYVSRPSNRRRSRAHRTTAVAV